MFATFRETADTFQSLATIEIVHATSHPSEPYATRYIKLIVTRRPANLNVWLLGGGGGARSK